MGAAESNIAGGGALDRANEDARFSNIRRGIYCAPALCPTFLEALPAPWLHAPAQSETTTAETQVEL
jgi:hypothetical protein